MLDALLSGTALNALHFSTDAFLEHVHWSWFLPTLKTYPESEQKLFLSALTPTSAKNLSKALDQLSHEEELLPLAKEFFRETLLSSLIDSKKPPLPISLIPESPFSRLLTFSKKELVRLINLLALHDLAPELKTIVDTKALKKISSYLTEEEKKILKTIHGEAPSRFLQRWDGSEDSFRTLLHRKGLTRFAMAISDQGDDFLWHLCHTLDIGRGSALFKLYIKEIPREVRLKLAEQLQALL